MPDSVFFNAQHAPMGAFATFTLGHRGAKGGLGIELEAPACEDVLVGYEAEDGNYYALPFYGDDTPDTARYTGVEQASSASARLHAVPDDQIRRYLGVATDRWVTPTFEFAILNPVRSIPDPEAASIDELKAALCPAVLAEVTLDNTHGTQPRKVFFGYAGSDPRAKMRRMDHSMGRRFVGVGQGRTTAIVTGDPDTYSGLGFTPMDVLEPDHQTNLDFMLGKYGLIVGTVPPGEKRTYQFAVCFYREGLVTTGLEGRYWYTRYFDALEGVASYALTHFDAYAAWAREADGKFMAPSLSADQRFLLAQAVHSYYASTQLLDVEGRPVWVVNEGEYRMMNTFDLMVDHLFFELRMNPWTVRNALDLFAARYSYRDTLRFPGDRAEHPGGISFTHDMGVANSFSPPGRSSYERAGLDDCFSYMTHEQLLNWILCATAYLRQTGDRRWRREKAELFRELMTSLANRDHPDVTRRDGVMSLDSSKCAGGAEITTYDSLDQSLGQSRGNLYLAVKGWGAAIMLYNYFIEFGDAGPAEAAMEHATLCAQTVLAAVGPDGTLPAIVGETGGESKIIPAIEGLVFPATMGHRDALDAVGPFGPLVAALRKHLEQVLQPGVCLFDDGGWKMSSTSVNSWLSKIFLCQFVARKVLGVSVDAKSDRAHRYWLTRPESAFWAFSDQIYDGIAGGSRYYPRGVTAVLWLDE